MLTTTPRFPLITVGLVMVVCGMVGRLTGSIANSHGQMWWGVTGGAMVGVGLSNWRHRAN